MNTHVFDVCPIHWSPRSRMSDPLQLRTETGLPGKVLCCSQNSVAFGHSAIQPDVSGSSLKALDV